MRKSDWQHEKRPCCIIGLIVLIMNCFPAFRTAIPSQRTAAFRRYLLLCGWIRIHVSQGEQTITWWPDCVSRCSFLHFFLDIGRKSFSHPSELQRFLTLVLFESNDFFPSLPLTCFLSNRVCSKDETSKLRSWAQYCVLTLFVFRLHPILPCVSKFFAACCHRRGTNTANTAFLDNFLCVYSLCK